MAVGTTATREETFEGTPSFTSIGGGSGAGKETVTFFQGAASGSRKVTSSTGAGFFADAAATVDLTATGAIRTTVMFKIFLSDFTDLNSSGLRLRIGDATNAYYEYLIHDDETDPSIAGLYPSTRSWLVTPVDPNVVEFRFGTTGSPNLAAVDEYGITAALATGAAKSENLFLDSVDVSEGLYCDGASQNFDTILDYDEGTTGNRYGHMIAQEGIYYWVGKLQIGFNAGAAAATFVSFQETGKTIVIPESKTAAGFNNFEIYGRPTSGAASTTDIDLTSCVFNGRGRDRGKAYASTSGCNNGVGANTWVFASEEIEKHDFKTGDAVVYSKEGGTTQNTGLTDGSTYYIVRQAISTEIGFASSLANAHADTLVTLNTVTATEHGHHSFKKKIDQRPDWTDSVSGADAGSGSAVLQSCLFSAFRDFFLREFSTFNDCSFSNIDEIDNRGDSGRTGATLSGCVITDYTNDRGTAFVRVSDLEKISNCEFTQKPGLSANQRLAQSWAVEMFATAVGDETDWTGNTFTGYSTQSAQPFDTRATGSGGDIDNTNERITITGHGFSTGDPIRYTRGAIDGGTQSIGLTDGNTYWIRSVDVNTVELYDTEHNARNTGTTTGRQNLTGSASQDTHYINPFDAALYISATGNAQTINILGGGDVPSYALGVGVDPPTINNNVSVTITNLQVDTEVRVYLAEDFTSPIDTTEIAGIENIGSPTEFTFSAAAGTVVDIVIFNVDYLLPPNNRIKNFTVPTTDTSFPVSQILDRNFSNP